MQIPQIRTVITTGQALTNTYNQLTALQQQKKVIENQLDQKSVESVSSVDGRTEHTELIMALQTVNRQINSLDNMEKPMTKHPDSYDTIQISVTAQQLFHS